MDQFKLAIDVHAAMCPSRPIFVCRVTAGRRWMMTALGSL
jgi:hypothetical protein